MKHTVRSIADTMGLSPATVSKALAGRPEVNEETKTRVQTYAKEIGYMPVPNRQPLNLTRLAIFLKDQEEMNVSSSYLYDVLMGFRQYAKIIGHEIVILSISEAEQKQESYDELMKSRQIDGAFIMGLKTTDAFLRQMNQTQIPTVLLDITVDNPMVGRVGVDNMAGVRLAIDHLAQLGHRRIGFVNGHRYAVVSHERLSGYMAAMYQNGLPYDPLMVFEGDYTVQSGAGAAEYFKDKDATALFFASDQMAFGAVRRFREMGVAVPEKISIVGFDDLALCTVCTPMLTTISQDRLKIGVTACALLECLLKGMPINHVALPPRLVKRESAGAAEMPNVGKEPVESSHSY